VVVDAPDGELAERRRQRVLPSIVRNAQRALEADGEVAPDPDAILLGGDVEHWWSSFRVGGHPRQSRRARET
jgi:hypothetical protein